MSFRLKPWYFEGDHAVGTRSASTFCGDPLSFFAHAMRVKWWYHAKFQPFQSSFCSAFQFQGHLTQNKSVNALKIANMSERVESWWRGFEWRLLNAKRVWSCNKLLKFWIAGVTDEFSSETRYFERDCPVCTRSASSFCRDPLYYFAHAMRVKWWYHAKFQPFQSSFVVLFNFSAI